MMNDELIKVLCVGAGGFLGSIIRYGFYRLQKIFYSGGFPVGTLVVNVLGCFLIGVFTAWNEKNSSAQTHLPLFVAVGILGGFTTFSAFGLDTLNFIKQGQPGVAVLNVVVQLILGLGAVYFGRQCFGG